MGTMKISQLVRELNEFTPCQDTMHLERMQFLVENILQVAIVHFSSIGIRMTVEALTFSAAIHRGERRKDNITPYFLHLLEVTYLLCVLDVTDLLLFLAAPTHDTVEKAKIKEQEEWMLNMLEEMFTSDTRMIVDPVSKKIHETAEENFQRIIRVRRPVYAWRVAILKLLDRLHSVMTFDTFPKDQLPRKIRETKKWVPILLKKLRRELYKLHSLGLLEKDEYLTLPDRIQILFDEAMTPYIDRQKVDQLLLQELGRTPK